MIVSVCVVHTFGRGGFLIWHRFFLTIQHVPLTRAILDSIKGIVVDSGPWSGEFWSLLRHRTRRMSAVRLLRHTIADNSLMLVRTALYYLWCLIWFTLKEFLGSLPLIGTLLGVKKYRAKYQHARNKEAVMTPPFPVSEADFLLACPRCPSTLCLRRS